MHVFEIIAFLITISKKIKLTTAIMHNKHCNSTNKCDYNFYSFSTCERCSIKHASMQTFIKTISLHTLPIVRLISIATLSTTNPNGNVNPSKSALPPSALSFNI